SIDQSSVIITDIFQTDKNVLDFVEAKQIDLVISLNKSFYFDELEARLHERGVHYLGCSSDTLTLSDDQLYAKQFMIKHNIPTSDWIQCLTFDEGENYLNKYPNQQQWIIRATNGNKMVHCKTPD
ncbi:unnamed protein product, partial [Adineta steineri]